MITIIISLLLLWLIAHFFLQFKTTQFKYNKLLNTFKQTLHYYKEKFDYLESTTQSTNQQQDFDLWTTLTLENNHSLISKLSRAEKHETGFNTIIIPKEHFSENLSTHKTVIQWLVNHKINTLDVNYEIKELEYALHSNIN